MFHCSKCGRSDFATGRAWKVHASRAHGGYSAEDWLAASRAASAPAGVEPFEAGAPETETAGPAPGPVAAEVNTEKFNAMKQKLAGAVTRLIWEPVSKATGAGELTATDEQAINEGWEQALACFDVKTEFAQVGATLRSPLWALALPLVAILVVLIDKVDYGKILGLLKPPEDKQHRGGDRAKGERQNNPGGEPDQKNAAGDRL